MKNPHTSIVQTKVAKSGIVTYVITTTSSTVVRAALNAIKIAVLEEHTAMKKKHRSTTHGR